LTSADLLIAIDGRDMRFPAIWLRDNCPCAQCVVPGTGQKLHAITELPDGLGITQIQSTAAEVAVTFGPDQHRSVFSRAWLARHALDRHGDGGGRTEDGKQLWLPADLPALPQANWADYRAGSRAAALEAVLRLGFVLLHGVPAEPGMVLQVATSFGFVRETNYGRLFDVRVEPAPGNLAFTSRAIGPHTDNPYRDPVPTLQLLHCLRDAAEGGDTGLVDGFAAAAAFRAADPEGFDVMTRTALPFGYMDDGADLRACAPLIGLSPRGRIAGVRFNNRSTQALQAPYAEVTAFYAAYRRWAAVLAEPHRQLNLRLAPGDCLIFDNTRILHARTAFTMSADSAGRHLQGCYADLDGLASTLAVLRRTEEA
jgi:gamma-butyrobetaine dioxygenase